MAACYLARGPGQEELAQKTLEIVLEESNVFTPQAPDFADALFLMGDVLNRRQAPERAIATLEEALTRYPDDSRATRTRFLLADSYRRSALGLLGELSEASYEGGGRFVFYDCVLIAPDLPEGAEEVLRINEIDVVVDLEKLLRGKLELEDVRLVQARFRISEDAHHTSAFNFMRLEPDWSGEDDGRLPPRVRLGPGHAQRLLPALMPRASSLLWVE